MWEISVCVFSEVVVIVIITLHYIFLQYYYYYDYFGNPLTPQFSDLT